MNNVTFNYIIRAVGSWICIALRSMRRLTGPGVISLPRGVKRAIVMIVDLNACLFTVWLAYYLRLGYFVALNDDLLIPAIVSIAIALPLFILFGMYRVVFRYAGPATTSMIAKAILLYGVLYFTYYTVVSVPGVPRTVGVMQPVLLFVVIMASRLLAYFWLNFDETNFFTPVSGRRHVLVYGTDIACRQLVSALGLNNTIKVCGFLDEKTELIGRLLDGYEVFFLEKLPDLKEKLGLTEILLAPSRIEQRSRKAIVDFANECGLEVKILPSLTDLADGIIEVSDLKKVDIEDLLGRDPVPPNMILMSKDVFSKKVMVTGAGGTIGSELCRQILMQKPTQLILVELNEYALYSIQDELQANCPHMVEVIPVLASVTDCDDITYIINHYTPDTVYHAAAYKHVPIVEGNVIQGVKNNVLGTFFTLKAATEIGVSKFVLVSTDKAVRPTNVMGASKRIAELLLQCFAQKAIATSKLNIVRFGNVLGSSGSVVPKFREQIVRGGPVTVTHREVTRYFMTIHEAAQLVMQAGAMARGGDVFILDMGQPVRIMDMAQQMIELSGLKLHTENTEGDIEIQLTGLRPGEKLYEELLLSDRSESTTHPRIMRGNEDTIVEDRLMDCLKQLETAIKNRDEQHVLEIIMQLVPEYSPCESTIKPKQGL